MLYVEHFIAGLVFAATGWGAQFVCVRRGWHGFLHRASVAVGMVALETAVVVSVVG